MATAKAKTFEILPMNTETVNIVIRGTSPLIVHSWSEKARKMILETQTKTKKGGKHETKIPVNDFMDSLYWLTEQPEHGTDDTSAEKAWFDAVSAGAKFGFPVSGIKQSIISGQKRGGVGATMTDLRGSFFLAGGTESSTTDVAEIVGSTPVMREDMVRVGGMSKSADIRHRAEFKEWEIPLRLTYIKDGNFSLEQILNMVTYGGFCCGIGEWRPDKNGQFGMYELVTA